MKPIAIPLSMSRIFLLPCQGGYLQVDARYEHDCAIYRKNLARASIPLNSVRYLFLTHHHDDHAGFLNELTRDADLTIIAHQQAQALLQSGQNDKTRGGGYVNGFIKLVAGIKALRPALDADLPALQPACQRHPAGWRRCPGAAPPERGWPGPVHAQPYH